VAWRERGERLLAAAVGLLGAGGGALEKRLAGTNEPIRLSLVDGLAVKLGGIKQRLDLRRQSVAFGGPVGDGVL